MASLYASIRSSPAFGAPFLFHPITLRARCKDLRTIRVRRLVKKSRFLKHFPPLWDMIDEMHFKREAGRA